MEGLKADFQTFVLEPFAELDQLLSSLNEKLGPSTQELVKNFATECTEWLKLQNSVANQEFVVGLDTVNAATMPLWEIPAQIETTRGSAQSFLKAVQNLRDATCAETFQEFFTYRSADIAEGKLSFDRISLLDMLKMMAENATSWLQIQQVEAARSLKELHEAIDGFKGDPSEFTIVRDFLVNNQEKTAETVAWVKDTVNSHHLAILMAMNLSTVLRFFKLG
jgi:hypothetical protein